jgi:hypothetical protein
MLFFNDFLQQHEKGMVAEDVFVEDSDPVLEVKEEELLG